jgi:hypothetical protein
MSIGTVFLGIISLTIVVPVVGWEKNGHWLTGIIAGNLVKDSTKDFLKKTLGAKNNDLSFDRFLAWNALWADVVAFKDPQYEWSLALHFAYSKFRQCGAYSSETACPNGRCIVSAIANYTERASNANLSRFQRAEAVKFVLHLVADLHQPLHLGFREDFGGNSIALDDPKTSLHHVWDHALVLEVRSKSDITKQRLRVPSIDAEKIQDDLIAWYKETTTSITCKYAYRHGDFGDGAWIEKGDDLDDSWFAARLHIVQVQLLKASVRLAGLLDAIALRFNANFIERAMVGRTTTMSVDMEFENPFSILEKDENSEVLMEDEEVIEKIINSESPMVRRRKTKTVGQMSLSEMDQVIGSRPQYHGIDIETLVLRNWIDGSKLFTYERIADVAAHQVQTSLLVFGQSVQVKVAIDRSISLHSDLENQELLCWLVGRFRSEFPEGVFASGVPNEAAVYVKLQLHAPTGQGSSEPPAFERSVNEYVLAGSLAIGSKVGLFTSRRILANPKLSSVWPVYCIMSRDGATMMFDARVLGPTFEGRTRTIVSEILGNNNRVWNHERVNGMLADLVQATSNFENLSTVQSVIRIASHERFNLFEIVLRNTL